MMRKEDAQKHPGFFYHKVDEPETINRMESVRRYFIHTMAYVSEHCPDGREKSSAITHLQTALMFAIGSLAMQGELQLPTGIYFTEERKEED